MPSRRVLVAAGVVVLLVAAALVVWRWDRGGPLDDAVAAVPDETLRLSFTDWAAVRERLGVGEPRGAEGIQRFLDRAYDTDLSASSSLEESAVALQEFFGFSPANAAWEALAQSRDGSALVLRPEDDVDFDDLADRLRDLGFEEPGEDDGVWRGGVDLVSAIDPTITPQLQYVALLDDEHLVVASDTASYAAVGARAAAGDGEVLADVQGVGDLLGSAGEPAAAQVWAGDFACEDLAMAQAAPEDQTAADRLISRAGGVSPLRGLLMSMQPDRSLDVVLGYESDEQAEGDLRPRAELAVGDATGRSAAYPETIRLTRSRTVGPTVVLSFRAAQRTGFLLSELNSGPVLLATC